MQNTQIKGGNVELVDAINGQNYISFPITNIPYLRAKKIVAETGEEFLYVQVGKSAVTDSVCLGLWVIGLHHDSYVTFSNLDTVRKAGLLFADISAELEDGELKLLGFARDRDCWMYDANHNIIGYSYKGHLAYPIANSAICAINSTYLFWDENAHWFGIRQAD